MLTATELHRRGLEATNAGRHGRARSLLLRALDRESDADIRARVLLTLAHVEAERGSRDDGLRLCGQALAIEGVSDQVRGLVHSQRALLMMRAGAGAEAIAAFAEAEPLLGPDPGPRARLHLNRGNVYLQQGDAGRAAADFERAVALAGDSEQRAKAEHNLGYSRLLLGDLIKALRLIESACERLDHVSPVLRAVGQQDRAEVLVACGMTEEAASALTQAAAAFGQRRLRQSQAEAELVLARMLMLSNPLEGARVARRAGHRFSNRGSEIWALRAEAVGVMCAAESGDASAALLGRADDLAGRLRRRSLMKESTELQLEAVRLLVRSGELPVAAQRLRRVTTTADTPLALRLLQREVRAELAAAQRRRSAAMRQVRDGLAELHDWQSSFGSLDLQSSLVGHGRRLALKGMALATADGRPEVVFEWSERARALASRVAPLRPPADSEAAAELTELRRLHAELSEAEIEGRAQPGIARRAAALRARIRQRAWYDSGSGVVTEPYALADVVAELSGSDGALLAYLVVDGRLHVLVAHRQHASVHNLGDLAPVHALMDGLQADLDMAAAHLPAVVRASVNAGLRERLAGLADHLVAPVQELVGDRPLVIVPSGSLAGMPWTMLPGFVGRPITVPRSASSWLAARWEHTDVQAAGFVAGPRVARAEEEARKAASAWRRATVLTGADATAAAVSTLAHEVGVLHVAAHGRHSADNPLFSGIELVDGPWFGYDIDQVGDVPAAVILSACELGRSSVRWGEETIGMTVAWLHAGARCVIASPALVDDDVACAVLAATHSGLAAGTRPAEALAQATADLVGDAVSPFICFGSGW